MRKLILKRLIQAIPMLIFISIISFLLMRIAPGDPIKAFITPRMNENDIIRIRHNLGLDQPVYIQYFCWLINTLKGNLGFSLINYRPVSTEISQRLPATLGLMGASLIFSFIIGIILGLISAIKQNKILDNIISFFCYIGISMPSFWLAMILIYFLSLKFHLLPSVGMHTIGVNSIFDIVKHAIMPCMVLSLQNIAIIARYVRSSAISQLKEDYVVTALAKGLNSKQILLNHVLKNSLLPVITLMGMYLSDLVSGAFITETIFGWPGMGRLGITSIFSFDYPVIMAITMLSSIILILGNLITDILYGLADPKIRNLE